MECKNCQRLDKLVAYNYYEAQRYEMALGKVVEVTGTSRPESDTRKRLLANNIARQSLRDKDCMVKSDAL